MTGTTQHHNQRCFSYEEYFVKLIISGLGIMFTNSLCEIITEVNKTSTKKDRAMPVGKYAQSQHHFLNPQRDDSGTVHRGID